MEAVIGLVREPVRGFMAWLAKGLNKISGGRISPDAVTIFGFAMHVPIALLISTRHNVWAAGLLVVFGLFDSLDGALARLQNRTSARGMLLDSVTDRMKEILLYAGLAYGIIGDSGRPYLAVWAVAACGCSLLTSYINAQGDSVMAKFKVANHSANKSFRGGLFPFEVRMFVLVVGLLSDRLALAAIVIAIGAAYTALSRLLMVLGKLRGANV
jgi:phosphatidylglycerophosphate synthase